MLPSCLMSHLQQNSIDRRDDQWLEANIYATRQAKGRQGRGDTLRIAVEAMNYYQRLYLFMWAWYFRGC